MCTKEPSPKNQESQVLIHLPQPPIHDLTSLGLFLKCQIKMENMYLLLYKFDGRIKRKSSFFNKCINLMQYHLRPYIPDQKV